MSEFQKSIKNRTVFCGDNIDFLKGFDSNSVDLIYLDPPFNKKRQFNANVNSVSSGASFKDSWDLSDVDEGWLLSLQGIHKELYDFIELSCKLGGNSNKYYLAYIAIRLLELKRILKDSGSIYLHCDATMSHFLKLLMDFIFGYSNFRNEIIWSYRTGGASKRYFSKKHDAIFFYSKTDNYYFNELKEKAYTKSKSRKAGIVNYGAGSAEFFEDELGVYNLVGMRDVWDIPYINSQAAERIGYPTQKPIALLERILSASCPEGGVVLDPFCGSATTLIASEKLNRQWIGIDVSKKAFELIKVRFNELDILKDVEVNYRIDVPKRTDI